MRRALFLYKNKPAAGEYLMTGIREKVVSDALHHTVCWEWSILRPVLMDWSLAGNSIISVIVRIA